MFSKLSGRTSSYPSQSLDILFWTPALKIPQQDASFHYLDFGMTIPPWMDQTHLILEAEEGLA